MLNLKFAEKSKEAEESINNGGLEMVELLKEKIVKVSEYVNKVVELDLLLLDKNTRDDRLVEQIGCKQYITDIDKLKVHLDNVKSHMGSGLLLRRELEDVRKLHEEVSSMWDEVNYLVGRNERLSGGTGWTGVIENTLNGR